MARDSNGNYSLPSGYKATPGETILASQHNPPLDDLASAMTGSLPRDGSAPMGGPVKTITGSASSPAIFPNGNPNVGIHFANGKVNFVGGATGLRYIGELIPYTFLTPEPLTVLPYGQTLLRASFPDLWAKAQTDIAAGNTFYNNGNGSTTFGIGDMRGRVPAGKDDMGGAAANRLTSGGSGINGAVIGAIGGAETHTLTVAQLAPHPHSGTTGGMNRNASHSHNAYIPNTQRRNVSLNDSQGLVTATGNVPVQVDAADISHEHDFTTDNGTGLVGAAHNNTQPTLVCNYLLYVGA